MPPKTKYDREDVIRAALEVVEEEGFSRLTARRVAARLGSSTAPIYQHFATIDELAMTMIGETKKMILDYTSRPYTDRIFLNMGTGLAMFACQHRELYRALLLEGDSYGGVVGEVLEALEKKLPEDKRFTSLSQNERRVLLNKMWMFTHGFASLICVGLIKDCGQKQIIDTLLDVGSDVIGATLAKRVNDNNTRKR
ncbi:MAG: TetR/AcrR family transcriptional regulator [Candidatus Zixiibacteriota bacterium]|nr:MAG: TetR/AcrR family transcriptional regulator [candidate division Zixibacteria bacterium]